MFISCAKIYRKIYYLQIFLYIFVYFLLFLAYLYIFVPEKPINITVYEYANKRDSKRTRTNPEGFSLKNGSR